MLETAHRAVKNAQQAIVSGQYTQAVALVDKAMTLVQSMPALPEWDEVRFALLLERGRARELMGDYAGIEDYVQVREHATNPAHRAMALAGIAECRTGSGEYEAAETAYRKALEESQPAGYNLCTIRSWSGLGTLYWKQGRLDEAVQALLQARAVLRHTPDVYEMGRTLISLGITHQYAGRLDQAIAAYEEALCCFRSVGDNHRVAAVLNNLGELHQELQALERALAYHEEAIAVAHEVGGDRIGVDITRNIGVDLLLLGRYTEAMMALNQALSDARKLGDKDFILQALYSLGDALLRQGEVERALMIVAELIVESKEVKSEIHAARAKYLQGRAHLANGERATAQAVFQNALGEAHATTNRMLLWQLHAALGRAAESPELAQVHFRIAADFIRQTVEPLTDPEMRAQFLEQPEVQAVLERAE
ncbi:MAG: tetratricopeptide repeat protein [Anaerolineae bacterium]|nr:tetratricopeptide repeat protein [Anaerolineae bacterium]